MHLMCVSAFTCLNHLIAFLYILFSVMWQITYEVAVVASAYDCSAGWCVVILVILLSLLNIVILFSLLCHMNKLYCLFINVHKAH